MFSMQSAAATPRLMAAEIRKVLAGDAAMEWPGDSYTEAVCPRWSQSVEPVPRIAALATTFASIVAPWAMLLAA